MAFQSFPLVSTPRWDCDKLGRTVSFWTFKKLNLVLKSICSSQLGTDKGFSMCRNLWNVVTSVKLLVFVRVALEKHQNRNKVFVPEQNLKQHWGEGEKNLDAINFNGKWGREVLYELFYCFFWMIFVFFMWARFIKASVFLLFMHVASLYVLCLTLNDWFCTPCEHSDCLV